MSFDPRKSMTRLGWIITAGIALLFAMNAAYYYEDVVTTREKMIAHKKATGL